MSMKNDVGTCGASASWFPHGCEAVCSRGVYWGGGGGTIIEVISHPCTSACGYTHIYIYTYICICIYSYVYIYIYIFMHICICAYVYLQAYIVQYHPRHSSAVC